jgi:hypothetical protein
VAWREHDKCDIGSSHQGRPADSELLAAGACHLLPAAVITAYDYVFAENGLVAYKAGELLAKQSLKVRLDIVRSIRPKGGGCLHGRVPTMI